MNLKISEDHPPTIGGWFLSFLLGRSIGFYNVFARCLGLTALRKNVKNLAISCMWSCTISRFPMNSHDISPVFFHDTRSKKKHFWKLFWWCSHNPKPWSGLCLWGRGLLWPPKSRRIGFAKSFLLQRWQQLRTCYCVSIFKKMYGEGPLTFLMAASRDCTHLVQFVWKKLKVGYPSPKPKTPMVSLGVSLISHHNSNSIKGGAHHQYRT